MRKLIARVSTLVLPKKEAKASIEITGRCVSGCGNDGVWVATSTPAGGKRPCC